MHITGDTIFAVIWFIVMIFIVVLFYKRGKKALSIFPDIYLETVRYRDRFASGYAINPSSRIPGRANKALDIVVTDKELWLKSMLLFAGLANFFGLVHRISLSKILLAERNGSRINLKFVTETGEPKEVVLITKNADEFLRAIKK